jgi:hypothetical protein
VGCRGSPHESKSALAEFPAVGLMITPHYVSRGLIRRSHR